MEILRVALDSYNIDALKQIGLTLNLSVASMNKSALVDGAAKRILEIAGSSTLLTVLDPIQEAVLALILEQKGEISIADLLLSLVERGLILMGDGGRSGVEDFLGRLLHPLLLQGLLLNVGEPRPGSSKRALDYVQKVGIASEVQKVLARQPFKLPAEKAARSEKTFNPVRVNEANSEQFLRRLFLVWAEIRRQPCKRLAAGGIGKRDLRRIAAGVGSNLEEHESLIQLFYELLVAMNMLVIQGDCIAAAEDRVALRFWTQTRSEQLRTLLTAYVEGNFFLNVDLDAISQSGYYMYRYLEINDAEDMRVELIDLLTKMVPAEWLPLDLFVSLLNRGRVGGFLLSADFEQLLNVHWYSDAQRSNLRLKVREAEFQATVEMLEPLMLFGLVELGYGNESALPFVMRLTSIGRAFFSGSALPQTEGQQGQLVLQPDFQMLALGPVALSDLAAIERIAERVKYQEGVIEYRLTRNSIYGVLRSGDPIGAILAFLQKVTRQPVPQNVERTLQEWQAQYERLVFHHNVSILQVDRAALLDRLLEHEALCPYLHRLDERTAWMHSDNQTQVEALLWELKLLPALSGGPENDLPRSLYWEDGNLRPRHPLPSLYSTGTVCRIAAEQPDGSWQLTPESVQTAVRMGLTAPEIAALVEKLTGTTLDPVWVRRLKLWSGHYGRAQTARLMVLAFENETVLQELRAADSRLRRGLHPLGGSPASGAPALAFAEESRWPEIQALLKELGLEIEPGEWWKSS